MGCESCYSGPAARERARQETTAKAKEYAIANKKTVAIYEDPIEGWQYCLEEFAIGKPIVETVSYFR